MANLTKLAAFVDPGRLSILHIRRRVRDMPGDICLITTTLDDAQKARLLARSLVEQHLAACVQVLPNLRSYYRWQGKVEEASEFLVQIKTTPARADTVMRWLARHHPYELAEIVRFDASASEAYAAWVEGSVSEPET